MNPIEILQAARKNIETYGWSQGALAYNAEGVSRPATTDHCAGLCSLGAILRAADIADTMEFDYLADKDANPDLFEATMSAVEAMDETITRGSIQYEAQEPIEFLTAWNDDLNTHDGIDVTTQLVLETFDKAIAKLQAA